MSIAVANRPNPGETAFVGRQPIFNPDLDVFGYELLFRSGEQNSAAVMDGDSATADVVVNAVTDIGLDVLTESKQAFVNLTRFLLLEADFSCLPPETTVLEVLECVEPDDAVRAAMRRHADAGYTIALDDLIYRPELESMIELADIVKIEFPQIPPDQLEDHIAKLRRLGVDTILAEKVETQEDFLRCKELGCDLFQGYFFCRPQVINRRRVQGNVGSLMRLVAELQAPDISSGKLAGLVRTDASLSYKVLRFVNSAGCAIQTKIESLEHAIQLLGRRRLGSLASMMLLASISDDKPEELMKSAMVRAKLCELLAARDGNERPERYFTLGLLSMMDAMLDLPMEEVLKLLPLSQEMNDALLHRTGELSHVLQHATSLQTDVGLSMNQGDVGTAYVDALRWTAQFGKAT